MVVFKKKINKINKKVSEIKFLFYNSSKILSSIATFYLKKDSNILQKEKQAYDS